MLPCVFDRHGGLIGERGEIRQLGGRVLVRCGRVERQDPQDVVRSLDGQPQVGPNAERAVLGRKRASRVILRIRDVERRAGLRHPAGEPDPDWEREALCMRASAEHPDPEHAGLRIYQEELDVRASGNTGGLAGNPLENRLEIQAGHDGARSGKERLQF